MPRKRPPKRRKGKRRRSWSAARAVSYEAEWVFDWPSVAVAPATMATAADEVGTLVVKAVVVDITLETMPLAGW